MKEEQQPHASEFLVDFPVCSGQGQILALISNNFNVEMSDIFRKIQIIMALLIISCHETSVLISGLLYNLLMLLVYNRRAVEQFYMTESSWNSKVQKMRENEAKLISSIKK